MTTRKDPAQQALQALTSLGEHYEVIPVDPNLADTATFCEHYGYPPGTSGNTILVASKRGERKYCACVVLATTRLDVNHAVRQLLGVRKASFASAEETQELTGMIIGGVTPFGLPAKLPIYVDERVMALEEVIVGGGDRSTKLVISPSVFRRMPGATIVTDLAKPAR